MSQSKHVPFIYNLFPPLVGDVGKWSGHVQRAAEMGFNWVFLNPIHLTGASGSLYAIREYFRFSPVFFPMDNFDAQKAALKRFALDSREKGVEVMVDLVVNHTAYDNPLTRDHRNWFKLNGDGSIKNPGAADDSAPGGYVTWGDLNEIDNEHSSDRNNLYEYWWKVVNMFLDCGVRGFRCDAAYQVPNDLWRMLIGRARERVPEAMFFAESLGCTMEQTHGLAAAGHDFVFNSGKWWDYRQSWFLDQLGQMAGKTRSISFPESHDTRRLSEEWGGDVDHIKQHYLFSALISSGIMIPIGFEYGFKKKPHVVHTNPYDYEGASYDLTDFIRGVNQLKRRVRVFQEDNRVERVESGNHDILALKKTTLDGQEKALLLFNLSDHDQSADVNGVLGRAGSSTPLEVDGKRPQQVRIGRFGSAVLSL